jgi:hypothetical protein
VSLHIFEANFLHYGLNGGHECDTDSDMPYILDKVRKLNEIGPLVIQSVATMLLEVKMPRPVSSGLNSHHTQYFRFAFFVAIS